MIKLVNDPRLVMLGWAAVVTVPAVVALVAVVAVVAVVAEPALVAKVALATVPVTLAPGIDDSPAPDPLNWDAVTVPVALTNPAVRMLPPVMLPVAVINPAVETLPPVTLPVTLTVVPVCVVALTLAPPSTLPPVMLPVTDTTAPSNVPTTKLPAEVIVTTSLVTLAVTAAINFPVLD